MDVTIVRHIIRAIRLHLRGTNEKNRIFRSGGRKIHGILTFRGFRNPSRYISCIFLCKESKWPTRVKQAIRHFRHVRTNVPKRTHTARITKAVYKCINWEKNVLFYIILLYVSRPKWEIRGWKAALNGHRRLMCVRIELIWCGVEVEMYSVFSIYVSDVRILYCLWVSYMNFV